MGDSPHDRDAEAMVSHLRTLLQGLVTTFRAEMTQEMGRKSKALQEQAERTGQAWLRQAQQLDAVLQQAQTKAQSAGAFLGRRLGLTLAAVVLVGAGSFYVGYALRGQRQQIEQQGNDLLYLDAASRADIVWCRQKRLCARIDDKAPRLGDKKQYRLIEPRQQP